MAANRKLCWKATLYQACSHANDTAHACLGKTLQWKKKHFSQEHKARVVYLPPDAVFSLVANAIRLY